MTRVRIVIPEPEQPVTAPTLSRRRFLLASATVGAAGAGLAGCAFGPFASAVEVTRHDVPVPGLPGALEGLRIAHITDTHFPANHAAATHALAHLREARPEVVILTGDMVEGPAGLDDLVAFAREARGTIATVAVRGNWEVSAGVAPAELAEAYGSVGVTYLQNTAATIKVGNARLWLAGLDDTVLGAPDARTLAARMDGDVAVWAMHGPGYADFIPAGTPASLLLAGHTHGGQIRLPLLPCVTPEGSGRFVAGWYDTPAAPLYVSRGVGTTAIRARLFCPPELPIITLASPITPRS